MTLYVVFFTGSQINFMECHSLTLVALSRSLVSTHGGCCHNVKKFSEFFCAISPLLSWCSIVVPFWETKNLMMTMTGFGDKAHLARDCIYGLYLGLRGKIGKSQFFFLMPFAINLN